MFNRAELKENAKKILSKNYWWTVLVTLIFGIICGSGTGININLGNSGFTSTGIDSSTIDEFGNIINESSNIGFMEDLEYYLGTFFLNMHINRMLGFYLTVLSVVLIASMVLYFFVFNPIHVGCRRWFLKNRKEKAELNEIVFAFTHGYKNVVKVMFFMRLKIVLWTLLLIIPGIIKSYEYRMIPYLLAENPEMDMNEAFMRSKKLMDGNKFDTFVLELSFIGWTILSGCVCGILNIFYVAPYMELTNTELYVCLCQGRGKYFNENADLGNNNGNGGYNSTNQNGNGGYGSANQNGNGGYNSSNQSGNGGYNSSNQNGYGTYNSYEPQNSGYGTYNNPQNGNYGGENTQQNQNVNNEPPMNYNSGTTYNDANNNSNDSGEN